MFPPFLKAYGFSYMPVYSSKKKTLFLINEDLWWNIINYVKYDRSWTRVVNARIKKVKFVHDIYASKHVELNIMRWQFLKHFKIIVQNPKTNPYLFNARTMCVRSHWFNRRFQPFEKKNYGSFYLTKWIIMFSTKPIGAKKISLGYFCDTPWLKQ